MKLNLPTKFYLFAILVVFGAIALIRCVSIDKTFQELAAGFENDWNYYAKYAKDIKDNGLLIPGITSNYVIPAGFFYNYFLAFCITIFGEQLAPIFVFQSVLLAISIIFIFNFFKDKLREEENVWFLSGAIIIALVDIFRHYSFLLLSENLAVFTVSGFFMFYKWATKNNELRNYLLAAVFLGVSVLTRPTIYPFVSVLIILLVMDAYKHPLNRYMKILFLAVVAFLLLLLPVRNYLITGTFTLLPMNDTLFNYMNTANELSFGNEPLLFIGYYFKKILFCLGFLPVLEPLFQFRPHWMIMWVGYLFYFYTLIKNKRKEEHWNKMAHLFLFLFLAVIILVAPITSYGFRMLIPVLFLLYGFAFIGLRDRWNALFIKNPAQKNSH